MMNILNLNLKIIKFIIIFLNNFFLKSKLKEYKLNELVRIISNNNYHYNIKNNFYNGSDYIKGSKNKE